MKERNQHRRSIRLQDYDYTQAGVYFVTIVTQSRACLFGDILAGRSQLNDAGEMIKVVWEELSTNYPGVETDHFVVMPNHIHGVVVLSGGQPQGVAPTKTRSAYAGGARPLSLPDALHRFKTLTTRRYALGVNGFGWIRFNSRLWQRNYFEHVIRNEDSLNRIRQYILDNPARWEFDRENPATLKPEPEHVWRQ